MRVEEYFPKGLALGEAFCNRVSERQQLSNNITSGQHTLIISPRRYGKTSLVRQVVDELDSVYGDADLFVAVDAERIQQRILSGVKRIIHDVCSSTEQALSLLTESFKNVSSKWLIGTKGIGIELVPQQMDPASAILEALQALEILLTQKKVKAVLFIDEIQEIGEVAEGRGIEGAIRHVAQESKYLSFIFSGSKRHLLSQMFYDKARPLYKLCERITLDRIDASDYEKHLNKLAVQYWSEKLSRGVFETIFSSTELHPYYMNALCLKVWQSSEDKLPTSEQVSECWSKLIDEEKQELMRELTALGMGQRKLLIAIANGINKELTGKDFLSRLNLSGSSISEAVNVLEQKDYLYKSEADNTYSILDPAIKSVLLYYFSFQ